MGRRVLLVFGWVVWLSLAYAMVVSTDYGLKDADSKLYEEMANVMARASAADWWAPVWPTGRFRSGLFYEHLPVFFWPIAGLAAAGASKATLLANFGYHLAGLGFVFLLARRLGGRSAGWLATFAYALSPIGIQYMVRGNHETAWGAALVGALWAIDLTRERRWLGAALCGLFATLVLAVKGALGLVVVPMLIAYAWRRVRTSDLIVSLACVAGFGLAAALVVEVGHHGASGQSFFLGYWTAQTSNVANYERGLLHKAAGPLYYASQIIWFSLPGTVLWALAIWKKRPERRGLLGTILTQALLTSLLSKRAARYVFSSYALVCVSGAVAWTSGPSGRLERWIDRHAARLPWILMGGSLLVLAGRIYVHTYHYAFVRPF